MFIVPPKKRSQSAVHFHKYGIMALLGASSVVFEADGGCVQYTLTNSGMTDLVYKIKSTNNKDYRFKEVYAFIKAGAKLNVEITRTVSVIVLLLYLYTERCAKAQPKSDKFIVQYAPKPVDCKDPQAAWKGLTAIGEIAVGIHALR
ncbi:unnamed protein product [Cylicostephanus goldi]|uniref:Major sperm protein n=1 Tax=Cylicostephanus goldi TaxID=71465 RepID=A0A3P7N2P8_CYLGO|nr:unnamed protein product [Cylicostephanus goldi]